MPLLYDSLRKDRGLTPHVAWRVAFIVPFILIVTTAIGMLLTCQDTPMGSWADRERHTQELLDAHLHQMGAIVTVPGTNPTASNSSLEHTSPYEDVDTKDTKQQHSRRQSMDVAKGEMSSIGDHEIQMGQQEMLDTARGETVQKPTGKEALAVIFSLQSLFHCATYMCSFGGELAINSYIASYYLKNFPYLGQTKAGQWGSMFGLLNVITRYALPISSQLIPVIKFLTCVPARPLGGVIADLLYTKISKNLWLKHAWISFVGITSGAFLIAIGLTNPHDEHMMFGLIAGMAFFLEAGNGANFALVPHVHPHANGIFSGTIGAVGNLGGVIFAILFRYHGTRYDTSFWIMGCMIVALNLAVCWIKPLPRNQIGGR